MFPRNTECKHLFLSGQMPYKNVRRIKLNFLNELLTLMENYESTTQKDFDPIFKLLFMDWKYFTRKIRGRKRYLRKSPPDKELVDDNSNLWEKSTQPCSDPSFLFPWQNNNNNPLSFWSNNSEPFILKAHVKIQCNWREEIQ